MTDRILSRNLETVNRRMMRVRMWSGYAAIWALVAIVGAAVLWGPFEVGKDFTTLLFAFSCVAVVLSVAWSIIVGRRYRDGRLAVQEIESKFPSLDSSLLTAVEQHPAENGQYSFLQEEVIGKAREHARLNDWKRAVPAWRMMLAGVANFACLAAAVGVFAVAARMKPAAASIPNAIDFNDAAVPARFDFQLEVEPGDTEIEKGTSLLVLARFPKDVPDAAVLLWQKSGQESGSESMVRSLEDPLFAGRIGIVDEPLTYSIEYGEAISETYQVTVFEYPRLEQADATLRFPEYTGLEDRVIQDVRRVTALRGTELTLECRLNKPVAIARLVKEGAEAILLEVDPVDPMCRVTMPLAESGTYRLELIDNENRMNKAPQQFVFKVTDNAEPKLKMEQPRKDIQASALEEIDVVAKGWDDFGLQKAGLSYSLAGGEPVEVTLAEAVDARTDVTLQHRIYLEDLEAKADDLLSFYFWADDVGPDGAVRRTMGDMFFAEIRPFEEIFRQGEQQSGQQQQQQQSGAQQQAEELAELQKQIISATWKVIRRETEAKVTSEFATDAALLVESQNAAIAQLEELAAELTDSQSQKFAADAGEAMKTAADAFEQAAAELSPEALPAALSSAQLAYQSLLRLRAREHQVVRSQQQSQSQWRQQSRSQQQLNELELDEEQNRYESQRTAEEQQQESAEEREDRQILNRLRELARRQEDLNERMKELQSALDEAETQAERDEIERQLKRLQEEQQQIVRDADELGQRMDEAQNQQRMSDQREQLDNARENARQASEALAQNQVSQASAQGTRAEEQFREMKDEFQRRTSNALAEQVRDLQSQAEEVAEKEQELADALQGENTQPESAQPSLRTADRGVDMSEQFEQQRERIADLTDRMQQTIEEAEAAEQMLLAEQLFDSLRKTQQRPPEEALARSELSLRRGLIEDAQKLEEIADQGIDELRDGIRKAAESVLGDDTEALRRARNELQRLSEELANEIARNDPTSPQPNSQEGQPGLSQGAEPQAEQADAGQQNGQRQAGESSEEQSEDGSMQRQGGEPQEGQGEQSQQSPPGQQPGENPDGEQRAGANGQMPTDGQRSDQPSNQPGQQPSSQSQSGEPQPGEPQPGEPQPGQQPNGEGQQPGGQQPGGQGGSPNSEGQPQQSGQRQSLRSDGNPTDGQRGQNGDGRNQSPTQQPGQQMRLRGNGGASLPNGSEQELPFMDRIESAAPLTGEDYLEWSDRLRDVEELLGDPKLRAAAAGIRDRAREVRREVRRHSADPNWSVVREMIAQPLSDLEREVNAELLRRTSDELVPLDRNPIPAEFEPAVQEYYKRLGAGR